ncbi:hypothetical protein [Halomonas denitrificans]|nr:hypothetical protein [Halomonas denitrificans]
MKHLAFLVLAGAVALASASVRASSCAGFSEQRLDGILSEMALLLEQVDALTGRYSPQVSVETARLRARVADGDPVARDSACRILGNFPTLEPLLRETNQRLAQPEAASWFRSADPPGKNSKGGASCGDLSGFTGFRVTLSVVRTVDIVLQGLCDSLSCWPGACRSCLSTLGTGLIMPSLEYQLQSDIEACENLHESEMRDYCQNVNGACRASRVGSGTLLDIESSLTQSITPTLRTINENVVRQESLVETRELIEERVAATLGQIDGLDDRLGADAQLRIDFQHETRTLDIEAALSSPTGGVPLQYQLPLAFGGALEEVREVVADAIVASQQAALDVGQALDFLRSGDQFLNNGDFASAFADYRMAYLELVQ